MRINYLWKKRNLKARIDELGYRDILVISFIEKYIEL